VALTEIFVAWMQGRPSFEKLPEKADRPVSFEESLAKMNELYETNSYYPEVKEAEAPDED
jgi:hypothetical protein